MKDYITTVLEGFDFTEGSELLSDDPRNWSDNKKEIFVSLVAGEMNVDDLRELNRGISEHSSDRGLFVVGLIDSMDVWGDIVEPYFFTDENIALIQAARERFIDSMYIDEDDTNITRMLDYRDRVKDCANV